MTFDSKRFSFALASAWAVWYTICALFVAVLPDQTQAVFSFAMHYDLTGARNISWISFFGGLFLTTVWVAVFGATIGWFFNWSGRPRSLPAVADKMAAMPR